jgi:hypothetical protein
MASAQLVVRGVLNFRKQKMKEKSQLLDAVIQLHNIARTVETEIGRGLLSEDIRDCADRLHQVINYDYTKTNQEN